MNFAQQNNALFCYEMLQINIITAYIDDIIIPRQFAVEKKY